MAAATAGTVGFSTLSTSIIAGSATLTAGGVPLVAGLFGAAGASLFSYKVHVLTKDISEFLFVQIPHHLPEDAIEEQNLLNLIDQHVETALMQLTKVVSHPQVLFELYQEQAPSEALRHLSPKLTPEASVDELITDFELMEDTEEHITVPLPAFDSELDLEQEREAAQEIVAHLEDKISTLRERLERHTVVLSRGENSSGKPTSEHTQFISVLRSPEEPSRMQVCVCASGWIWSENDFTSAWAPVRALAPLQEMYSLRWESMELQSLGRHLVTTAATGVATKVAQSYVMQTFLATTLSALALPMTALQLSGLIGHPWTVVFNRAKKCGKLLAHTLLSGALGTRPITLVGFSHGARLLFHCLEELARQSVTTLVENVYLLGAPVVTDPLRWGGIRKVVSGRVVNGYSPSDWILLLHKMSRVESTIAGLEPVECQGVENVDLSDVVPGHLLYRQATPAALKHCGFGSSIPRREFLCTKSSEIIRNSV